MKQHVLIISQCFAPQNKIGAVRATKLAKYLLRMGYQVTVLAGADYSPVTDPLLARDLEEIPDAHILRERSLLRWWKERGQTTQPEHQAANQPTVKSKPRPLINTLYLLLNQRADDAFARACVQHVKRAGQRYDVVLSSYGPLSVHTAAERVKQLGYAKRWIADFRDETTMPFRWQKPGLIRYNNRVKQHADQITAVSAGYLRVMGMEKTGQVIYNGFDPEDLADFPSPPKRADKLTFIHCGQMYGSQRDLSPFFRALAELIREGTIPKEAVALIYAGHDTRGFVSQATDAGLADCLEGHGFIPRDESLTLQKAAHVLLLPAWNQANRQGNIPGKLLEYMLLAMPVICCVSGELKDSEIAGIIAKTQIGICYEQANDAADYPRLKKHIAEIIHAYQKNTPIPFTPDREAVGRYTSEGMARKMANIMEEWT